MDLTLLLRGQSRSYPHLVRALLVLPLAEGTVVVFDNLHQLLDMYCVYLLNVEACSVARVLKKCKLDSPSGISSFGEGLVIVANHDENYLSVIRVSDGEEMRKVHVPGMESPVGILQIAADVVVVACGGASDAKLKVVRVSDGTILREFNGFNYPQGISRLDDVTVLVADSGKNRIAVFNTDTGELLRSIEGCDDVRDVAVLAPGTIAATCGKSLKIIDFLSGAVIRQVPGFHYSRGCALVAPDIVAVNDLGDGEDMERIVFVRWGDGTIVRKLDVRDGHSMALVGGTTLVVTQAFSDALIVIE